MSEERINDELTTIEAALCSLTPAHSGIERDRLMFLAGKASVERASSLEKKAATNRRAPNLLWPMATAASLAVAMIFGMLWGAGNNPRIVDQTIGVSVADLPRPMDRPADTSPPSPWENRRLYRLVLEKGFDALPESTGHFVPGVPSVPRDESYRSLLRQFLDNPTG